MIASTCFGPFGPPLPPQKKRGKERKELNYYDSWHFCDMPYTCKFNKM